MLFILFSTTSIFIKCKNSSNYLPDLILPQIVVVHTYPSHESIQEYNHNQEDNSKNVVTKLHHSSTVLSWTTESLISTKSITLQDTIIHDGTEQDSSAPLLANNGEEEEYYYDEATTEDDINQRINLEQVNAELENKANTKDISENDVKRSAEIINKATLGTKIENKISVAAATLPVIAEANNYTNFTQQTLALSTNTSTSTTTALNTTTTRTTTITTYNANNTSDSSDNNISTTTQIATQEAGIVNDTTTLLPQAPSSPRIVKAQTGKSDWLNTAQFPPAHLTTDDGTHDYPEDDHKIPFTLENVSEHRSRKSKVLSADYKVNRYINYSTDSKNHLTRSTTEFEEPNISSERLSVQVCLSQFYFQVFLL